MSGHDTALIAYLAFLSGFFAARGDWISIGSIWVAFAVIWTVNRLRHGER